jgi:arylsulfatase A-like enzyme
MFGGFLFPVESQPQTAPSERPNILFLLADDMTYNDLKYMPRLKELITDQGVLFTNYFVNVSVCCPSRVTILRGQYSHNTHVYRNRWPRGGFATFHELGEETSTVAVWLKNNGYKTALIGKYLNGYPGKAGDKYIPPGWSEWYSPVEGNPYQSYTLNENGKLIRYGKQDEDYSTDVYGRIASDFILRATGERKPFFLYLAPAAPHTPALAASRHNSSFSDVTLPQNESFSEFDVSDKPKFIQLHPMLTKEKIDKMNEFHRMRLQSLQAVDEMISDLVAILKDAGQLHNTYIFFSSDNGFHQGQHRLWKGKNTAYEEDVRVPLIVRGPGVPLGQQIHQPAGNVDLAPTWSQLAGVKSADFVDGRSLVEQLNGHTPENWRQAFLLERLEEEEDEDSDSAEKGERTLPPYTGLRTKNYKYVEYKTGEVELYDLANDPQELNNLAGRAEKVLLSRMGETLEALRSCSADSCRLAESGFTTESTGHSENP